MNNISLKKFILISFLSIIISRLLPHPPNFTSTIRLMIRSATGDTILTSTSANPTITNADQFTISASAKNSTTMKATNGKNIPQNMPNSRSHTLLSKPLAAMTIPSSLSPSKPTQTQSNVI